MSTPFQLLLLRPIKLLMLHHMLFIWNQNIFSSAFISSTTTRTTLTHHHQFGGYQHQQHQLQQQQQSTRTATYLNASPSNESDELEPFSQLRAAVFQPPAPSHSIKNNPLGILTQAADCLRVASIHKIDLVLFPELYLTGGSFPKEDINDDHNDYDNESKDGTAGTTSLDRESYELSIIGNLCAELNVACAIGYAEKKHESEMNLPFKLASKVDDSGKTSTGTHSHSHSRSEETNVYNSVALFHADGTRAGNFRCTRTSATDNFLNGHPFVEVMPVNLNLPSREGEYKSRSTCSNQLKVGVAVGNEIFVPEHCRHLARSGTQLLLSSSAFHSNGENEDNDIAAHKQFVLPTRAVENGVPILSANYVGGAAGEILYKGSSGIISSQGRALVMAPEMEDGDMPCDEGYLLPCETGALYAADLSVQQCSSSDTIQSALDVWDLAPRIAHEKKNDDNTASSSSSSNATSRNGFGKEVEKIVNRGKKKNKNPRK